MTSADYPGGVSGKEHPDTARCLRGLARAQMEQDEDALAEPLLERALAVQEKALGPEHPDAAATQHTLGELRSNRGDVEAGLELMTQALVTRQLACPDTQTP